MPPPLLRRGPAGVPRKPDGAQVACEATPRRPAKQGGGGGPGYGARPEGPEPPPERAQRARKSPQFYNCAAAGRPPPGPPLKLPALEWSASLKGWETLQGSSGPGPGRFMAPGVGRVGQPGEGKGRRPAGQPEQSVPGETRRVRRADRRGGVRCERSERGRAEAKRGPLAR